MASICTREKPRGVGAVCWEGFGSSIIRIGGSPGDLVEKVRARGHGASAAEAREYIRQNCQVQWLVVENDVQRNWAEHYILAMLRPIWCS
jgi:hypothetical protein